MRVSAFQRYKEKSLHCLTGVFNVSHAAESLLRGFMATTAAASRARVGSSEGHRRCSLLNVGAYLYVIV